MKKNLSIFTLILYFFSINICNSKESKIQETELSSNFKSLSNSNSKIQSFEKLNKKVNFRTSITHKFLKSNKFNDMHKFESKSKIVNNNNDGIVFENWVEYRIENNNKSSNFLYLNDEFFIQNNKNFLESKDFKGINESIPNQNSFYLVVYKNFISINSTKNHYSKKIDLIDISTLSDFKERSKQKIFSKLNLDKNCLKMKVEVKSYIFCFNTLGLNDIFINIVLNLKENQTKNFDQLINKTVSNDESEILTESNIRLNKKNINIGDGYWQLLKDWSSCSLKCGGGIKLQQWMCIPPKKENGKKCTGDSILKIKCNNQPCQNIKFTEINSQDNENKIIKIQPFLTRSQRYEKYHLLEKDVLLKENNVSKIPVRLVINQNSLTIYKNEKNESALFALSLNQIQVQDDPNDFCCVKFSSQTFYICGGFGDPCGNKTNPLFLIKIKQIINEFISSTKKIKKNSIVNDKKVDDTKNKDLQMDILSDKENLIKEKLIKRDYEAIEDKEKSIKNNFLKMMKKEHEIEKIIEQEEREKVLNKQLLLKEEIKKATTKKECFENILKSKIETVHNEIKKDEKDNNLKELKDIAKQELIKEREIFKQKIIKLRKKAAKQTNNLQKQITIIRNEMKEDLAKAQHKGSVEECTSRKSSSLMRKLYCDNVEILNAETNYFCSSEEEFCEYCCGNEFGEIWYKDQVICLKACNSV